MTYEQALAEERSKGAARCSDGAVMAGFCDRDLQHLVGAAGPRLVWEGAQKSGMTALDLHRLCISDPLAVHDLMWI